LLPFALEVKLSDRLVQLGKFGAFPAKQLLGRHYDVTYEIYQSATAVVPEASSSASAAASFGQGKGKKKKATGGGGGGKGNVMSNPGWKNALKPLKERALIDAVVGMSICAMVGEY
jgi:tRNA (adenine-N(1)-)-methyltransferase non-catalytic subunit